MWYDAWLETLMDALSTLKGSLPTIAVAVSLVLVGWALAHLSRRLGRRLSERLLDRLGASSASIEEAVESSGTRGRTQRVVAGFLFWLVFLVFLAAAVETLGLPVMTDLLGKLAAYAPNLLAAALIALAGVIVARVVRSAALRAAEAGGIAHAPGVAAAAESIVIVLVAVIALEQLGVNGRVLELTVAVTVGSALAAVALAFALGARSSVANLIAAHYLSRLVRVGQSLVIDGIRGKVLELTPTAVVVETVEGRVVVPAQRFHDTSAVILNEED
jgi:small-conductance mechanosensitive channel